MATRKKNIDMEMSFYEHLDELRKRLIIIAIIIFIAAVACFTFIDNIIFFLTSKAENLDLIYTTPAEAFMSQIRLSILSGVADITFYPLPGFGLHYARPSKKEKSGYSLLFSWSCFLYRFIICILCCVSYALYFFLGFSTEGFCPCLPSAAIFPL